MTKTASESPKTTRKSLRNKPKQKDHDFQYEDEDGTQCHRAKAKSSDVAGDGGNVISQPQTNDAAHQQLDESFNLELTVSQSEPDCSTGINEMAQPGPVGENQNAPSQGDEADPTQDSLIKLLCDTSTPHATQSASSLSQQKRNRSLLFEAIIDLPSLPNTPMETRLARIEHALFKSQIQIDKLERSNVNLTDEIKNLKAQLMVKDKEIEKLSTENAELKLTIRTQNRQLSKQINELDTLSSKVITLDNKNAEQRKELLSHVNLDQNNLTLQQQCTNLEAKMRNKEKELQEKTYELGIMTAKFESLQNMPSPKTSFENNSYHGDIRPSPTTCGTNSNGAKPIPAPRRRNGRGITVKTNTSPPLLIMGNSNVKGIATRVNKLGLGALAFAHSSARIAGVTESVRRARNKNLNPEFVMIHATDIDIHSPTNPGLNSVKEDINVLIQEAKRTFPHSKICMSSAPLYKDMTLRHRAQEINDFVRRQCVRDDRLLYISNENLQLWKDDVHFTYISKDLIARNIIHVTRLVKKNDITLSASRPAWS